MHDSIRVLHSMFLILLTLLTTAPAPCSAYVMEADCNIVIESTIAPRITSYGSLLTDETFCTSENGASYSKNTFQFSFHTAPIGHRLVLSITQWETEEYYDMGTVFLTSAGVTPTATVNCNISGAIAGGIPMFSGGQQGLYEFYHQPEGSPVYGVFGGGLGLCFFSDSTVQYAGIGYFLTSEACPEGSYCPGSSFDPIPCPAGTFSALAATDISDCLPCAAGTFSGAGSSECTSACPAGFYASPPATCFGCAVGRFNPNSGSTSVSSCIACAPGKFNSRLARGSSCESCAAGTFSSAMGASLCTSCPAGTFNPDIGSYSNSSCLRCPAVRSILVTLVGKGQLFCSPFFNNTALTPHNTFFVRAGNVQSIYWWN